MKQVIIEERDLKEGELPVNKIIHGNALTTLKKLPSESVDCVITSPPFWGLRDYGTDTKIIWNGDPNCNHEWQWKTGRKYAGGTNSIIGQFSDANLSILASSFGLWAINIVIPAVIGGFFMQKVKF